MDDLDQTVRTQRRGIRQARGHRDHPGQHPKISVRFSAQSFEQIEAYAVQCGCTFAEAVRLLVDYAFDKLDQEESNG